MTKKLCTKGASPCVVNSSRPDLPISIVQHFMIQTPMAFKISTVLSVQRNIFGENIMKIQSLVLRKVAYRQTDRQTNIHLDRHTYNIHTYKLPVLHNILGGGKYMPRLYPTFSYVNSKTPTRNVLRLLYPLPWKHWD